MLQLQKKMQRQNLWGLHLQQPLWGPLRAFCWKIQASGCQTLIFVPSPDEKGGVLKLSKGKRPPPCSESNKATQYLKREATSQ